MIQTVLGPIENRDFGWALVHEHILLDWQGVAHKGQRHWSIETVVETMQPYLSALRSLGYTGFVECTPPYLGRDPLVLRQLAEKTGIHIVCSTGLYKEPFIPASTCADDPSVLVERWVNEFQNGIEDSGVHPGFIKVAVPPAPFPAVTIKIVQAAAQTSLITGLPVVCHTEGLPAAREVCQLVEQARLPLERLTLAHMHCIEDVQGLLPLAKRGAWLSFDGVGPDQIDQHLMLVRTMVEHGLAQRVLVSQDRGWYDVGKPGGGPISPYTFLPETFVPRLRKELGEAIAHQLLVDNPTAAITLHVTQGC